MRLGITAVLIAVTLCSLLVTGEPPVSAGQPVTTVAPVTGPPVKVAATIFPITSIVRTIGGERVEVTNIVPSGADPHHFEITPTLARSIHEADLVFLIGGPFDQWVLAGHPSQAKWPLLIELHKIFADSLIPLEQTFNPHFWLDPLLAKSMGMVISMALCTVDLANCNYYQARTEVFCSGLDSLHAAARESLASSGFKDFVSFHPAWTYFARRFGLNEIAVIELGHEQEPSPKRIARIIEEMKQGQVDFIIVEEFSNPVLAEAVAAETGAEIIVLDPLGSDYEPGRDSYFGLIDYNTAQIVKNATGRRVRH